MGGRDPGMGVDGEGEMGPGAVGGGALCLLGLEEGGAGTGQSRLDVEEEPGGVGGAKGWGIDGEGGGSARVVAVVEIEGREPGGGVDSVVVSKLNGGEVGVPIVLEDVDVVAEAGKNDFVRVL